MIVVNVVSITNYDKYSGTHYTILGFLRKIKTIKTIIIGSYNNSYSDL